MIPTTDATRRITIELTTRTANLLTASSVHEGMNVEDYIVAAAVTAAGRLIDEDLAAQHTNTPWQFVDERWLRRHARRLRRYLRRHRQFFVTLRGEPVGYLLHAAASDGGLPNAPRPVLKRHR
jgi:uncharacterized protein (DUF1778 family)